MSLNNGAVAFARGVVQDASPDAAAIAEKTADALKLRIQGLSYRKIARQLGIGKSAAHSYVIAALADLREQNSESAAELRQIEAERCDAMIAELWPRDAAATPDAPTPTLDARTADTILRISERRAKLFGLDTVNAPPASNLAGEITIRIARDAETLAAEAIAT